MECYRPENRHQRKPTWSEATPEGRWRCFDYEELAKRDKLNLDIFWLKDKSLEDSDEPARAGRAGPGDRRRPPGGDGAVSPAIANELKG